MASGSQLRHESTEADRFVAEGMPEMRSDKRRGTRLPPSLPDLAYRLAPICQAHGIIRLEVFGSTARGEATVGSDVDLIAHFRKIPGLAFISIIDEMERALGVPVDLLSPEDVDESENPFQKALIQRDRRTVYAA